MPGVPRAEYPRGDEVCGPAVVLYDALFIDALFIEEADIDTFGLDGDEAVDMV